VKINPWNYAKPNTEHSHQVALFIWASVAKEWLPQIDMMFAIPNGGERNKAVASRLKAEGVKPGVPDIFLPVARHGAAGLFIELKRIKSVDKTKGVVSTAQTEWQTKLRGSGYWCATSYGWLEAKTLLLWYLLEGRPVSAHNVDERVKLVFGLPIE
jgi:hypothetical protein